MIRAVVDSSVLVSAVIATDVADLLRVLRSDALMLEDPSAPEPVTRDPDDDYLVALARASGADVLVSSDRDLLEAGLLDLPVRLPRDFPRQLADATPRA